MLLNKIRITRKKEPANSDEEKKNDTDASSDEMEERQVVDELFVMVQKPAFDIASDAYKTLQLLLTRNKKLVPIYLNENYDKFFGQFNQLIQSDNYVTQRQFLNLLSELLLEKTNFNLMIKYIAAKENLKIAMTLLKNESNAISHEAFHIFKVFVANPKKERDIHIVLWKNKEKLITFLTNFLPEKAKEDEAFAEEKKIVIKHLESLPIPEEIEEHRRRREEKKRAQSQGTVLSDGNHIKVKDDKQHSKSIGNVVPPPTDGDNQQQQQQQESEQKEENPPKDNAAEANDSNEQQ